MIIIGKRGYKYSGRARKQPVARSGCGREWVAGKWRKSGLRDGSGPVVGETLSLPASSEMAGDRQALLPRQEWDFIVSRFPFSIYDLDY